MRGRKPGPGGLSSDAHPFRRLSDRLDVEVRVEVMGGLSSGSSCWDPTERCQGILWAGRGYGESEAPWDRQLNVQCMLVSAGLEPSVQT